jgi:hypothetical protein
VRNVEKAVLPSTPPQKPAVPVPKVRQPCPTQFCYRLCKIVSGSSRVFTDWPSLTWQPLNAVNFAAVVVRFPRLFC